MTRADASAADPLLWLAQAAQQRDTAGLHRVLKPRSAESAVLDLASNDYLGLSRDPRVLGAAGQALAKWGAGATGSRLVTGSTELHAELEDALAVLVGAPAALVFSSGYLANLAAVSALAGRDCLVVSDAGNHASLVDACRLARSALVVIAHGDQAAAEQALSARSEPRAVVVLDAINSADGDLQPLAQWQALTKRCGALLIVDDAHGIGVRGAGRGAVAEAGIAGEANVITTISLSKALGAQGGAVLGAPAVIAHLIDTARSFIFDTGLNPAAAGAALAAARIIESAPELARAVLRRSAVLAAVCGVPATGSAIVPVLVGDARAAYERSVALLNKGVRVGCFRPPSVPAGTARLRITGRANLSDADVELFRRSLLAVSRS